MDGSSPRAERRAAPERVMRYVPRADDGGAAAGPHPQVAGAGR